MTDERIYEMTPERAKALCDLIGECWHEVEYEGDSFCRHCGEHYTHVQNRTFATPADAHRVMEALKEKGLWKKFIFFVIEVHNKSHGFSWDHFTYWLRSNPERECCLAADFWMSHAKKKPAKPVYGMPQKPIF